MCRGTFASEDDLALGVWHVSADGLHIGLPHVHGDRLDAGELVRRQPREVALEAGLLAVLRDVFDGRPVQVADERQVLVPLGDRLLVDAEVGRRAGLLGAPPALDGPLEDARPRPS